MTDEQLHELMEAHRNYSMAAEVFKSAHEEIKRLREEVARLDTQRLRIAGHDER